MPTSKIKMSPSSYGKTSYTDSEFQERLLWIMGHSLTVLSFEHFAWS